MTIYFRPRKIQQIGMSYYIALPVEWRASYNFDKGDKLQAYVLDDGAIAFRRYTDDVNKV